MPKTQHLLSGKWDVFAGSFMWRRVICILGKKLPPASHESCFFATVISTYNDAKHFQEQDSIYAFKACKKEHFLSLSPPIIVFFFSSSYISELCRTNHLHRPYRTYCGPPPHVTFEMCCMGRATHAYEIAWVINPTDTCAGMKRFFLTPTLAPFISHFLLSNGLIALSFFHSSLRTFVFSGYWLWQQVAASRTFTIDAIWGLGSAQCYAILQSGGPQTVSFGGRQLEIISQMAFPKILSMETPFWSENSSRSSRRIQATRP